MILTYRTRHEYEGRGKHRTRIATYYRVYEGDRYIAAVFKVPGGFKIYHEGGGESFGKTRAQAVDNFVKNQNNATTTTSGSDTPRTIHA